MNPPLLTRFVNTIVCLQDQPPRYLVVLSIGSLRLLLARYLPDSIPERIVTDNPSGLSLNSLSSTPSELLSEVEIHTKGLVSDYLHFTHLWNTFVSETHVGDRFIDPLVI